MKTKILTFIKKITTEQGHVIHVMITNTWTTLTSTIFARLGLLSNFLISCFLLLCWCIRNPLLIIVFFFMCYYVVSLIPAVGGAIIFRLIKHFWEITLLLTIVFEVSRGRVCHLRIIFRLLTLVVWRAARANFEIYLLFLRALFTLVCAFLRSWVYGVWRIFLEFVSWGLFLFLLLGFRSISAGVLIFYVLSLLTRLCSAYYKNSWAFAETAISRFWHETVAEVERLVDGVFRFIIETSKFFPKTKNIRWEVLSFLEFGDYFPWYSISQLAVALVCLIALIKAIKATNPFLSSNKKFIPLFEVPAFDLQENASNLLQFNDSALSLSSWLSFAFLLYVLGLFGRIFNQKNFIVTRRSVERRYLGVITSFVLYGTVFNDPRGSIYGLLLVILAACEAAIGLGLIIVLHRFSGSVRFQDYKELGG